MTSPLQATGAERRRVFALSGLAGTLAALASALALAWPSDVSRSTKGTAVDGETVTLLARGL